MKLLKKVVRRKADDVNMSKDVGIQEPNDVKINFKLRCIEPSDINLRDELETKLKRVNEDSNRNDGEVTKEPNEMVEKIN